MPARTRQKEDELSLELARSLLSYDSATGILSWKRPPRRGVSAGPAGCRNPDGYLIVGYRGHLYLGMHLIWFIQTGEWPEHGIDHRDGNPWNDKWSNLRAATCAQNNYNLSIRKDNRTGVRGVMVNKRTGVFTARIGYEGKKHHLGDFRTLEAAAAARRGAELRIFGAYSSLNRGA